MNGDRPVTPPIPGSPYNSTPPPSRGRGRGCFVVAMVLMVGSLLVALALVAVMVVVGGSEMSSLASSEGRPENRFDETVLDAGSGSDKIVIIQVHGILMSDQYMMDGASTEGLIAQLRKASADRHVKAIVLDMNTPGGEVISTDEVYHEMQKLRQERNIKIITCMRSVAASGGYYLAAGTDWIVANRMTFTGSVGVIMESYNIEGLMTRFGIQPTVYKSGPKKDIMSMARPPTDDEVKLLQGLVDETFNEFATIVANGRNIPLDQVKDPNGKIGDARVVSGREALELGLVDELGYMEDAIAAARTKSSARNASVVLYERKPTFGDLFLGITGPKRSPVSQLIPGVPQALPKGHLYYICPFAR